MDELKSNSEISIRQQYIDVLFEFTIYSDLTSDFKIKVSKTAKLENNANFVLEKMKVVQGYVYFLKSDFGYKIGFSKKLLNRMNVFRVSLPFKFELHSTIKCTQYQTLELTLHELLNHKRLNGEWFSLDESDFIDIDKLLKNMGLERRLNVEIKEAFGE